jgi:hypothetical protein
LKKKQGNKKLGVTRLTRLIIFFLLKQCRFDLFKKKRIDPGDPDDPVKTWNPDLEPGRV